MGLKWFEQFFNSPNFSMLLANTLIISIYSLVVSFPFPIILALILNYVKNLRFKKFAQTVTYMPYFISTVVLVAMMTLFFSPSSGFINTIIESLGASPSTLWASRNSSGTYMCGQACGRVWATVPSST